MWLLYATASISITRGRSVQNSPVNSSDDVIWLNLGLPSFDTLLTNAAVTFARLWSSCTNHIVMHLRQLSLFSV